MSAPLKNTNGNPHQRILAQHLEEKGLTIEEAFKTRLLFKRYDIWHLHWVDGIFNSRYRLRIHLQTRLFFFLLFLAKKRQTKIVWTIHNLEAHEKRNKDLQPAYWQRFLPFVDAVIHLSDPARKLALEKYPRLKPAKHFVIPRGHYRDSYPNTISKTAARKKLGFSEKNKVFLYFGNIRAYKNLPHLCRCFEEMEDPEAILVLAGRTANNSLDETDKIKSITDTNPNIHFFNQFIPDDKVQVYFNAADLTVFPYKDILNSGALVLSLSYSRPSLVPGIGTNLEQQDRFGKVWVKTYQNELTANILSSAMKESLHEKRDKILNMDELKWDRVATQTAKAFQELVKR